MIYKIIELIILNKLENKQFILLKNTLEKNKNMKELKLKEDNFKFKIKFKTSK